MPRKPISFRWPEELLERIDYVRGDVPRSRWIERQLETILGLVTPPKPDEPLRAGVDLKAAPDATRSGYVKPFEPRPKG